MSRSQQALVETTAWTIATELQVTVDARGKSHPQRRTYLQRFFDNVQEDERGCWLWTKSLVAGEYAGFNIRRAVNVPAHRWAYALLRAEIPEGLQLDHLCRVRRCVNPWHADPVDNRENQRRGENPRAGVAYRNDTCTKGHDMADAYWMTERRTGKRHRRCRPCHQQRTRRTT